MTRALVLLWSCVGMAGLGCGKGETQSLVLANLHAEPDLAGPVSVTVAVADVTRTFSLDGIPAAGVRVGVYVPDRVRGVVSVNATAEDGRGCPHSDSRTVDIDAPGKIFDVSLTLRQAACGDGGRPGVDASLEDGPPSADVLPDTGPEAAIVPAPPTLGSCLEFTQEDTPPNCDVNASDDPFGMRALAFSPDGRYMVSSTALGGMEIWEVDGPNLIGKKIEMSQAAMMALGFAPNGSVVAGAGEVGSVYAWSSPGLTRTFTATGASNKVLFSWLFFANDNDRFITAGVGDSSILVWSLAKRTSVPVAVAPIVGLAASLAAPATGSWWVAVARTNNFVSFFDLNAAVLKPTAGVNVGSGAERLALAPDTNTLAVAGDDGIILWDVTDKNKPLMLFPPVRSKQFPSVFDVMAFSPSGHHLVATIPGSNGFGIYSVDKREETGVIIMRGHPWAVAFSPDGRGVAVGRACGLIFYCRD